MGQAQTRSRGASPSSAPTPHPEARPGPAGHRQQTMAKIVQAPSPVVKMRQAAPCAACSSAGCGAKEGACARPYLALSGAPRFQGGCRSNWQSAPIVRSTVNVGARAPVVSLGFARYIPYTQVSAITGGSWQFVPVPGQLVVALPSSWPASYAQQVAKSPSQYGYTLAGSTYVPASLTSGDQYLLAGL